MNRYFITAINSYHYRLEKKFNLVIQHTFLQLVILRQLVNNDEEKNRWSNRNVVLQNNYENSLASNISNLQVNI